MNLSEDEIIPKYGRKCGHCRRNTLLECDWTCVSCVYNVIKRKQKLSKIQREKNQFL